MNEISVETFLPDLVLLLRERALQRTREVAVASGQSDVLFAKGRLTEIVETLSLIRQQAIAFGIEPSSLHLAADPEKEFLRQRT